MTTSPAIRRMAKAVWHRLPEVVRLLLLCWRTSVSRRREARRIARAIESTDATPVLVLTMPKVGSMTLYRTLAGCFPATPVVQIHATTFIDAARRRDMRQGMFPVPLHLHVSKRLLPILSKRRVRIVTSVRDPIARHISAFFQAPYLRKHTIDTSNLKPYQGRFLGLPGEMDRLRSRIKLDKALPAVLAELDTDATFDYCFGWFDREIRRTFDVDVFAHPFDKGAGYAIIRSERADIFIAQSENLSSLIPTAITDFLELGEPIEEIKAHVRKELAEGAVYESVLSRIVLSPQTCERIYSHRFVRHFYDQATIDEWIEKWTAPAHTA